MDSLGRAAAAGFRGDAARNHALHQGGPCECPALPASWPAPP